MSDTNSALESIRTKKSFKEISREIKAEMNIDNPFNEMKLKLLHDWAVPIYSNSKIQNAGRVLIADLSFQMHLFMASDNDKLLKNKPYNYVVYIHHDGNEVLKMYNDPEKKPKDPNQVVIFIETDDGKFDFGKIVRVKFGSNVKSDLEKKSGIFESNEELLAEKFLNAAYAKSNSVKDIKKVDNETSNSDFKNLLVRAIINEHKNLKFDDFSWLLLIVEGVEYIGFKLPNLIFEGSHWLRTKMYKDKKYWNGALPEKEYEPPFFPDFIFYNNPKDRKIAIKNILIEPISKLQKDINEKIASNNPINHILRKEINKIFENIYQIMGDFIDKLSNFEIPDGMIDKFLKLLNAFWVGLYNGIIEFIAGIMDLIAIIILRDTQQFGFRIGDGLKETFENLLNDIVHNTEDFFKKIIKKVFDLFVNFAVWYNTYEGKSYYILKEIGEILPDVISTLIPVLKGSKISKGAGALNAGREIGEEAVEKTTKELGEEATEKTIKELSEAEAEQIAKEAREALENGTARETVEKAGKEAENKLDDMLINQTLSRFTFEFKNGIKLYFYNNIEVGSSSISKSGFISFDINIPKHFQKLKLGTELIEDSIRFFENQGNVVNGFQSRWLSSSKYEGGISTNLKEFVNNYLEKNLTLEEAALITPTGKIAAKNGFTKVSLDDWEILDLGGSKPNQIYWIELKYKKP